MKNVTIKDVAKAAGVSYSTVSRALSGSPEISVDTRERILCRFQGRAHRLRASQGLPLLHSQRT